MKVLELAKHVGPDAEVEVNEKGAGQSKVAARLDLMPALAELAVGEILQHGADRYGEESWRDIPDPQEHLNHALIHGKLFLAGDQSEGNPIEHLARCACRALFALEMEILRQQGGGEPREPFKWSGEVESEGSDRGGSRDGSSDHRGVRRVER